MWTEQRLLMFSLVAILAFSALGITFGLITGSSAIIFDGVFSIIDAGVSVISITVAGLIARSSADALTERMRRRFTMGFWHLEPMVLVMSSLMMLSVTAYAIIEAVRSLLRGGRPMDFGPAIVYAVIILVMTTVVATVEHRANRRIRSALVALDVKGWVMAGGITAALLIAFIVGLILQGAGRDDLVPYVDPLVLLLVGTALLPVPIGTLRRAAADMLLVTPADLRERAEAIARQIVEDEGFTRSRLSVARVGRAEQVEIEFHVPPGRPARPLEEWDAIRDQVRSEFQAENPDNWVTVSFTTRPVAAPRD
ncbi:MAG: cation transporter [Brachybacterium sp.]|nr:cation transporter [Brachybacterium sp.]